MASAVDFRALARQLAKQRGLDPSVFERQIQQESGFNPSARSPAGAQGIAQIMPGTAKDWGVNPNDPAAALNAAATHMADYLHRFGNMRDALVAYNAGPGAVGGKLPAETQGYVKTILGGLSGGAGTIPPATAPGADKAASGAVGSTFDQAAYEQARRRAILGQYLAKDHPNSLVLRSGLATTRMPDPTDFMTVDTSSASSDTQPSTPKAVSTKTPAGKIGHFERQQVPAWMLPALRYARANGWKGSVTSGVRTRAEQQRLYDNRASNPNPVAEPGTSNHEINNGGAIDVSDPDAFAAALAGFKGRLPTRDPSINDPVHFSSSGR